MQYKFIFVDIRGAERLGHKVEPLMLIYVVLKQPSQYKTKR